MAQPQFDELIHPSTRLSLVAVLASADWADFAYLKDRLSLSDSALSKQLTTLEAAGYVTIERRVTNRRRRVRAQLTDVGRRAFEGHVAALQAVISAAEPVAR
jgi:DNA-binding MarR family transcriptional regulator